MAGCSGKATRKKQKIRLKSVEVQHFFSIGERISRPDALRQACEYLESPSRHTEAIRLIALFNMAPEELSEAGLGYESLRVLDRHGLFI